MVKFLAQFFTLQSEMVKSLIAAKLVQMEAIS